VTYDNAPAPLSAHDRAKLRDKLRCATREEWAAIEELDANLARANYALLRREHERKFGRIGAR